MFSKKPKTQTGPTCGPYAIANGLYLTNYIQKNQINPFVLQTVQTLFQKNQSYVGEIFSSEIMQQTIHDMIYNQPLKIVKKEIRALKPTQLENDLLQLQPNEFALLPIQWGDNLHWIGVIHQYGKLKYYNNHTRSLLTFKTVKMFPKVHNATNVAFNWQPWITHKIKKNKYTLNALARIGKHKPMLQLINQHLAEIDIQKLNGKTVKINQIHYFLIKQKSKKEVTT